jgi:hypothetical protein
MRQSLVLVIAAVAWLAGPAAGQSGKGAVAAHCIGSDAETKDPAARERICLDELKDRASRSGNVLSLKLDNGQTKVFRSDPEGCAKDDASRCTNYYLVGFLPAAGRYLVYGTYYESFDCKLVSSRTGKATSFRNVPHFAPDGVTFFVTGYDGTYDNWLGIGSIASDPPALVWEKGPNIHEDWEFVRWVNNDRVALRDPGSSETCPDGNCEAVVKRSKNAWTLQRLLPRPEAKGN